MIIEAHVFPFVGCIDALLCTRKKIALYSWIAQLFQFMLLLQQVAALQEEKSSLLAENQILMERLNQSDSIEDPNSPAGRRHLQLQTQLEQLQEETFR